MAGIPHLGKDLALLAVSSDLKNATGRIVYRNDPSPRTFDLRFDLGEIEIAHGRWGFPSVIPLEPGFIPNNVALTADGNGRTLFLGSVRDHDQVLLVKHYDIKTGGWSPAAKIVDAQGDEIQAHKMSHFAASQSEPPVIPQLSLYFINENNALVELVGKKSVTGYSWSISSLVDKNVLSESRLAVAHRDNTTYVLYQTATGELSVATRTGKDWKTAHLSPQKHEKGTAVGISITAERPPVCYFTERDTIYAQSFPKIIPLPMPPVISAAIVVGSHHRSTNIGALSFPGNMGPDDPSNTAHVVSVSLLDNARVVLERVHRSKIWPEVNPKWEIPAGVLDTPPPS